MPEIAQVLTFLKIPFHLEDKKHPADFFEPGRARYRLKNEDNTLVNPDIKNSKILFLVFLTLCYRDAAILEVG